MGCSTNSEPDPRVHKDVAVRLVYKDTSGNNLLDPAHSNAITEQNTDTYFLRDGQKEKIFEGNLDCPKMFCIVEGNNTIPYEYFMKLFPNTIEGQDTAITYLQFDNGSTDTIKVAYNYSGLSVAVTKVWYNQELRFDPEQDGEENPLRYIVITKDWE